MLCEDAVNRASLSKCGPDWKYFCGAHSVVYAEILIGHQVIMIEIVHVKERGLGHDTQFHLSSREFKGQHHNTH